MKTIIIFLTLVLVICFSKQVLAEEKINLFASTNMVSKHVAPDGTVVINNLSNQTYVEASYGSVTLFNWNNYDIKKEGFNEHDLGVALNLPKFKSLNSYVDFQYWGYPDTKVGYELTSTFGIKHYGWVDSHFKVTHQFGHKDLESGRRFWMEIAKNFSAGKVVLIPKIQVAYLDNFFKVSGLAHITTGVNVDYSINKNIKLSVFLNYQKGFEMQTCWYEGLKVGYSF